MSAFRSALTLSRSSASLARSYHRTPTLLNADKDDQDRQSLKPRASDNTKSGSDDEVAAHHGDAAFNPNKTRPEQAKASSKQANGNPLEVSGANQELSKPQGDQPSQKVGGGDKKMKSGGGSPPKEGGK